MRTFFIISFSSAFITCISQVDTNKVFPSDIGMIEHPEPVETYYSKVKNNNVLYVYRSSDSTLFEESSVKKCFLRNRYKRTGLSIGYYPDGKISCFGSYVNDKKQGIWKFFTPEGKLIRKEMWRKNMEVDFTYYIKTDLQIRND